MATIYQHIDTGKAIILNPREALIFPFDLGSDWNEIRYAIAFSLVTTGNDNAFQFTNETLYENGFPRDYFYIGLKNNSTSFPYEGGDVFLGLSVAKNNANFNGTRYVVNSPYGELGTANSLNPSNIDTPEQCIIYNGSYSGAKTNGTSRLDTSIIGVSGSTQYYELIGCKVKITGGTFYTQDFASLPASNNGDLSIATIRQFIRQMPSVKAAFTGFYTSNYTIGGSTISTKPDAIFIYSPMMTTRIRVHHIFLERFY